MMTRSATTAPPPPALRSSDRDTQVMTGLGVRPRRAEGIELMGEFEGSGFKQPRFMVRRRDGQIIQLTDLLYLIAERCDGSRAIDEIAGAVSKAYGKIVSPGNVEALLNRVLRRDGIVEWPDGSTSLVRKQDPLLALRMRVTLLPERVANFFAALLRPLFWPPLVVAVVAGLVGLDIWYFGVHGIAQGLRDLIYQPLLVLFLYGLLIVSVGWHELGHATACRYGGARPGRIGFGIYIVWPAFFTDVTDAYRLPKGGRIRTDLGGIYFNAIFCLAIGAVYAATGFEPLLVLIVMQHLLIAYQFMPFLRLDGYQVMSDATGIPDLFSRVGPVLQGLIPFRTTPKKVRELKPWVRAVVTLWVLAVVPFLVYMFSMMVVSAPRILATAWDSFFAQKGAISDALAQGHDAAAATAGIQMTLLVLPVLGMGVTFSRVSRRVVGSALRVTSGRPLGRAFVYVLVAGAIGVAAFVLWPNGDYTPIQPGERWTAGDGLRAVTRPSSPEDPATGSASGTTSNSVEGSAAHDARGPVAPSTSSSGSSSFASGAAMPGEPTTSGGASGTTSRIGSAGTTPTPSATPSPSESPTASPSPSTTPEPTPSSTP